MRPDALNAEARAFIDQLRAETTEALVSNKAVADEQVASLRETTREAIITQEHLAQGSQSGSL